MNATPPVLPAFIPDAGAAAAATATQTSTEKPTSSPSFAGTLKDVGAKAGHKPVAVKEQTGQPVPPAGKLPPPPPAQSKPTDEQPVNALPLGTKAPVELRSTTAMTETAIAKASSEFTAGRPVSPLPVGVAVASVASADTAAIVSAPASSAESTVAALQSAPVDASGNEVGQSGAASPRVNIKTALPSSGAAVNAVEETDADDDANAAAIPIPAAPATAAATVAALPSAPPSIDSSDAAAVDARAGSRSAYSAAADEALPDAGAAIVNASTVAGASLTDASLKISAVAAAQATAIAAQATVVQSVTHVDKHGTITIDTSTLGGAADAAAGVSQLVTSAGTPSVDAAPAPVVRVAANVDSADFPQDLSSRVSWMVDNNINGAKLSVNPPQLGPIELRIVVSGEHAQVWMTTHSAVTRDALESSTPKLREMLGTQGFSQVSVDISQRSFQERSAYSPPYEPTSSNGRSAAATAANANVSATTRNSLGVVDAYA